MISLRRLRSSDIVVLATSKGYVTRAGHPG